MLESFADQLGLGAEARRLLQRYSGVREALQERMATGVSAGECAVLIEERLRNQWSVV